MTLTLVTKFIHSTGEVTVIWMYFPDATSELQNSVNQISKRAKNRYFLNLHLNFIVYFTSDIHLAKYIFLRDICKYYQNKSTYGLVTSEHLEKFLSQENRSPEPKKPFTRGGIEKMANTFPIIDDSSLSETVFLTIILSSPFTELLVVRS